MAVATESNFRALKDAEVNNLIVPLVGDFAGARAIRSVATYLKERKAIVTASVSYETRSSTGSANR